MIGKKSRIKGFTLIELMVVLAIVGLLASLAVPRYFHMIEKSKETALHHDLSAIRDALDKYYEDAGKYPDSLVDLVDKKYLRKLPKDPITNSEDTWLIVEPDNGADGKVFNIRSGAPGNATDGTPYSEW